MTFARLEDRFKASSDKLYKQYVTQQLNQILPDSSDSRSSIKNDTRELPRVSTGRDLKLITAFLKSSERGGPRFLAKQLLLQTGNTFAETRLYNPLGALIHTVPFVHAPRNLGKFLSPLPIRTDRGALQSETINKFKEGQSGFIGRLVGGAVNAITSPFRAIGGVGPDKVNGFYRRPEDEIFPSTKLAKIQPMSTRGSKKTLPDYGNLSGRDFGYYDNAIVNGRRNLFVRPIKNPDTTEVAKPTINKLLLDSTKGLQRLVLPQSGSYIELMNTAKNKINNSIFSLKNPKYSELYKAYTQDFPQDTPVLLASDLLPNPEQLRDVIGDARRFDEVKADYGNSIIAPYSSSLTFKSLESKLNTNGYFSTEVKGYTLLEPTSIDVIKKSGSIIDQYNVPDGGYLERLNLQRDKVLSKNALSYAALELSRAPKSDIIQFVFKAVDGTEPIHFRALISNIKENVKSEYNETRYVGRTERFVTYAGAKRSVSLDFNIVAFAQQELDQMWTRINYLTGLAFPRGVSVSGFMVPPLFRLTIGGIYDSQPCYVESLDSTLLDETITFDIDQEVSQTIAVNMTITLMEKRSRYYDSPFYKITEDLQTTQANKLRNTQ